MIYGRLVEGRFFEPFCPEKGNRAADNKLQLSRVTWHDCDGPELLRRHQREAKLVLTLGRPGLEKVGPYLLRRLADTRLLRLAWNYLASTGGQAPGPSGEKYSDVDETEIWPRLRSLSESLRTGEYEPCPEKILCVSKGPGRGTRPLVLQDIEDRVVQRAVVEIAQPLLDPKFDRHSFGFRPKRGTLHALAYAAQVTEQDGRGVWLTQDIKDAFLRVPLPRLMQIVCKYLISKDFTETIERVLSGASTPGLRQGGPLSPLLLNLYLHHFLDVPWRKLHPKIPLLRYADDLLLPCQSVKEARMANKELKALLMPAGMVLKYSSNDAIRRLTPKSPAEWLGFRIERQNRVLRFKIGDRGWERLAEELSLTAAGPDAEKRAPRVIYGWLSQMGPAYHDADHQQVYQRLMDSACGIPLPSAVEIKETWQRAFARWCKLCKKPIVE